MSQINFMDESQLLKHFRRPNERPFLASEKAHTTILFSGLPLNYEHLIKGALEGLGYRLEYLDSPDNDSLAMGKEYCNRGQCNPTYYTVGNLVKYLKELRERGEKDIEERYAYINAGNCGNCRFGMYEAEYRKSLIEAGFPNFRVMTFEQSTNFSQSGEDAGLQMDAKFYTQLFKAFIAGDFIHQISYRVRPYEIKPGETDRVTAQSRDLLYRAFKENMSMFKALTEVNSLFSGIQVDYTRIKPRVKITGEFYAQTTESAANYHLFRWLESEGAEVLIEPVTNWVEYVFTNLENACKYRFGMKKAGKGKIKQFIQIRLVRKIFHFYYWYYRLAMGFKPASLVSVKKMNEYAAPYYDYRIHGGEGHLEIAKHIMSVKEGKAHMIISVKPFGCMPSTQSDGVQAKVVTDLGDSVFIAVETSGDSEVHFKSRVQMKLFEAKEKAREEADKALKEAGFTYADVVEYSKNNPAYFRDEVPHRLTGIAADYILNLKGRNMDGYAKNSDIVPVK